MFYLGAYQPRAPEDQVPSSDTEKWEVQVSGQAPVNWTSTEHATKAVVNFAIAFIESMNYMQCLMQVMMSDAIGTLELAHKNLSIKHLVPLLAKSIATLMCKWQHKIHTDSFNSFLSIFKSSFFFLLYILPFIVKSNFKAKKNINNIHWLLTLHCFLKVE